MQPSVGRMVHYVSRGSADGEFPSLCRAAIVTEALDVTPGGKPQVGLAVINPMGVFFDQDVTFDEGSEEAPMPVTPYDVIPDSLCGDRFYGPGTWHWPAML